MARKGERYIGGHSIVHGSGRLGLDRPTFGLFRIRSKNSDQHENFRITKDDLKWRSWAKRRVDIGTGTKMWPVIKFELEQKLRQLPKLGIRNPTEAAELWNSFGFRTFCGNLWRRSLVLTASIATGINVFRVEGHHKYKSKPRNSARGLAAAKGKKKR